MEGISGCCRGAAAVSEGKKSPREKATYIIYICIRTQTDIDSGAGFRQSK